MNLRLDGRKALVCGSSKGIGRAVAYRFAEMGADVILTARSEELLNKHINEMPNNGRQKHDYLAADFQEPDKLILAMRKKFGNEPEINILVNNSGGPPPGLLHKAGPGDFIKAVERHLISSHLLMKLLLPHMKKNSWGRIINIISISVKQPVDNLGVSNTLRGAMNSWSKTLSNELAQYGITVNNVLPGQTKTGRLDSLISNIASEKGISEKEVEQDMISKIPAGRLAMPEETAAAAAFLACDEASFITGVNIPVDGGYLKCL